MGWKFFNSSGQLQTEAPIADNAITNAKLADDAVGADELAANAVVNASIASGAEIQFSKMENLTNSRLLVSDGSGDVSVSAVTAAEILQLSGLSANVTDTNLNALTAGSGETSLHSHAAGGAVTRVGGITSEATTQSGASTPVISITSLSIGAGTPFWADTSIRRTNYHPSVAIMGIRLNSTTLFTADCTGSNSNAEEGQFTWYVSGRGANYTYLGETIRYSKRSDEGSPVLAGILDTSTYAAFNATITSFAYMGHVSNTGNTLGVNFGHVYTRAVS